MTLHMFVQILGAVLIFLAAIKTPEPPANPIGISYGWMGVFLLVLTQVFGLPHS